MTDRRFLLAAILCFAVAGLLWASMVYGTVAAVKVTPDGLWRVEVADYRQRQVFELWATLVWGG